MIHIHVFLAAPLRPCHTTQSGADQHQRRISVREGSNHPRPAPDLPVHPLDHIVGSDLHPMLGGEVTVGQRFLNASPNQFLDLPLIISSLNCTILLDMVCRLLSNVCVATSFYQRPQAVSTFLPSSICAIYYTLSVFTS